MAGNQSDCSGSYRALIVQSHFKVTFHSMLVNDKHSVQPWLVRSYLALLLGAEEQ